MTSRRTTAVSVTSRCRQLVALVRPTLRSIRWDVPIATGALVVLLLIWKHAQLQSVEPALWIVRGIAFLLTIGALPLLDDAAARQVAAVPVPLALRSAIRLVAFGLLVFLPEAALAAWTGLPVGSLQLETAAVVMLSCTASTVLGNSSEHSEPSTIVSMGLLPLPGVLSLLPQSAALLVPAGTEWTPAHQRWAVLCAVGAVALALALRDPAARNPFRRRAPNPAAYRS